LCQVWIAAGRPPGEQTLGMFESWAEVIGGILNVIGVPGLLANAKEFRTTAADQMSEWRSFVAAWWAKHQANLVVADDLYNLATQEKLLDSVLGDKGERSQRVRLGKFMPKMVDRVFGEYRIDRAREEDHKSRQQYRLQPVTGAAVPEPLPQVR